MFLFIYFTVELFWNTYLLGVGLLEPPGAV